MTRRLATHLRRRETLLAAGLAALALVEIGLAGFPGNAWRFVPFALLWTLPLALARRAPLAAGLIPLAAAATEFVVLGPETGDSTVLLLAAVAAFATLGAHPERRLAVTGMAAGIALLAVCLANDNDGVVASDIGFAALIALAPFIAGRVLAERSARSREFEERAQRLEREQHEAERAAVLDERARIARELHDVIAHSVSVMTVQAGAARMMLGTHPDRSRAAVLTVEETGREALAETRRLLGILRSDMTESELRPQPGVATLDDLVRQMGDAGLAVDLSVQGSPGHLSPGIDLTVYRVVQEVLTTALARDVAGSSADVKLHYADDRVEIVVIDNGRPSGSSNRHGPDAGVIAMRERVAVYGGEFTLTRGPHGAPSVRVTLPREVGS